MKLLIENLRAARLANDKVRWQVLIDNFVAKLPEKLRFEVMDAVNAE